ncbi:competence protein ComK [Niallia sp. 01092]|uniref:competence protein ComK n=1 Tax=unclassified Niallia TaxID=2837522 RepID=UPI003FD4C163
MEDLKDILIMYEINFHTLAIEPFITQEGKIYSKIYEGPNIFFCILCPTTIVKRSCMFLGSSYDGRRDATRALMNYNYKLPIVIDSLHSIYFFPTHSPSNSSCVWISLHNILAKKKIAPLKTLVIFRNQQQISVSISMHSLNNQMMRANSLQNVINYNQNKIQKTLFLYENNENDYKKSEKDKLY